MRRIIFSILILSLISCGNDKVAKPKNIKTDTVYIEKSYQSYVNGNESYFLLCYTYKDGELIFSTDTGKCRLSIDWYNRTSSFYLNDSLNYSGSTIRHFRTDKKINVEGIRPYTINRINDSTINITTKYYSIFGKVI